MVTRDGAGASHDLLTRLDALAGQPGYQVIYSAGLGTGRTGEGRDYRRPPGMPGRSRSMPADRSASAAPNRPAATCAAGTAGAGSKKRTPPSRPACCAKGQPGISWPAGLRRCGSSPAASGRTPVPSSPCSRPKTAGGTPCGSPTGPPAPRAGWASPPISTPLTGCMPGRRCHPHRQRMRHRQVPLHLAGPEQGVVGRCPDRRGPAGLAQAARPRRRPRPRRAQDPALPVLHAAAQLTRGGRRRRLNIAATGPWAPDIVTARDRISALPHAS